MRRSGLLVIPLLFTACINKPTPITQAAIIPVIPVPAKNIISKFKNTPFRRRKINQGATGYVDTTFKRDVFVVKDSVNEILTDDSGRPYIILGKPQKTQDFKCYFTDDKVVDSLKVNQIITVSSKSHVAIFRSLKLDTAISALVVEMDKCSLIKK